MPAILGRIFSQRQPLVKIRISNDIPEYCSDELNVSPAAIKAVDMMALIDTGATSSAIDDGVCADLMLRQQSVKQVLYPNMTDTVFKPAFTCALGLFEHYSTGSRCHDWPDLVDVLSFDLEGRAFQAVIGMDILSSLNLRLERGQSIELSY